MSLSLILGLFVVFSPFISTVWFHTISYPALYITMGTGTGGGGGCNQGNHKAESDRPPWGVGQAFQLPGGNIFVQAV